MYEIMNVDEMKYKIIKNLFRMLIAYITFNFAKMLLTPSLSEKFWYESPKDDATQDFI